MSGEKHCVVFAIAVGLGVLGPASTAWPQTGGYDYEYEGGYVKPCSLEGVNPAYHPEIFANPTAARGYGFAHAELPRRSRSSGDGNRRERKPKRVTPPQDRSGQDLPQDRQKGVNIPGDGPGRCARNGAGGAGHQQAFISVRLKTASPVPVIRENVISCLHDRVARVAALGVVRLRRLVGQGAGPKRS